MANIARKSAFPIPERINSSYPTGRQKGMDMLQYFAGQALVGLAASNVFGDDPNRVAHASWAYAKALLRFEPILENDLRALGPIEIEDGEEDEDEEEEPP